MSMQRGYTYADMGTGSHGPLTRAVVESFENSTAWPVIFHNKITEEPEFVILEVNIDNVINDNLSDSLKKYFSKSQVPVFYANFIQKQFSELTSLTNTDDQTHRFISLMIQSAPSSHIFLNQNNTNYFTVDFDYLVFNESKQKSYAIEVTTLFKTMHTADEAMRLANFIAEDRRQQHGGSIVRQIQTLNNDSLVFNNCELVFSIFNSEGRTSKVNLTSKSLFSVVDHNFLDYLSRKQFDYSTFFYSDVDGFIDFLKR